MDIETFNSEINEEFLGTTREVAKAIRQRWQNLKLQIQERMVNMKTSDTWDRTDFEAIVQGPYDPILTMVDGETLTEEERTRRMLLDPAMFARNFVKDVRLMTMSECTKIMMVALEEIDRLFQTAKLQKQQATSNVTTRSTSKIKRVETSIQAEQLKTKFEELKQCIGEIECSLEGVEAEQNEQLEQCYDKLLESVNVLKGIIGDPKESMEAVLADAERKIEAVLKKADRILVTTMLHSLTPLR